MAFQGEGFRYRASEFISKKMSVEKMQRGVADLAIVGAIAMVGMAYMEDGQPSEEEQKEIFACAAHLTDRTETMSEFSFPEECSRFTGSFDREENDGFMYYTLPSEDRFLDVQLWTSTLEEDRSADLHDSLLLMTLGLAGHGIIAFRRRLQEVDLVYEAEKYLQLEK